MIYKDYLIWFKCIEDFWFIDHPPFRYNEQQTDCPYHRRHKYRLFTQILIKIIFDIQQYQIFRDSFVLLPWCNWKAFVTALYRWTDRVVIKSMFTAKLKCLSIEPIFVIVSLIWKKELSSSELVLILLVNEVVVPCPETGLHCILHFVIPELIERYN